MVERGEGKEAAEREQTTQTNLRRISSLFSRRACLASLRRFFEKSGAVDVFSLRLRSRTVDKGA